MAGGGEADGRGQAADAGADDDDVSHRSVAARSVRVHASAVTRPCRAPPTRPTNGSPKNTTKPIVFITAHHVYSAEQGALAGEVPAGGCGRGRRGRRPRGRASRRSSTAGCPGSRRSAAHSQYPLSTICGSRNRSHAVSAAGADAPRRRRRDAVIRRPTSSAGTPMANHASGTMTGTPATVGRSAPV